MAEPRRVDASDDSARFFLPLEGDMGVEIKLSELSSNVEYVLQILKAELVPLNVWRQVAVELYKRGHVDEFLAILEQADSAEVFEAYISHGAHVDREQLKADKQAIKSTKAAYFLELRRTSSDRTKQKALLQRALQTIKDDDDDEAHAANPSVAHMVSGLINLASGQYKDASNYFNLLLDADRDERFATQSTQRFKVRVAALLGSARCLYHQGKYNRALHALQEALRENPLCPASVRMGIGLCFHHLKDMTAARAAFERVLELHPWHSSALAALAIMDFNSGDESKVTSALARLTEAFHLNPDEPMVLLALAEHFALVRDTKRAISLAQRAEKHTSSKVLSSEAHYQIGRALHFEGRYASALLSYERACTEDPTNLRAQLACGQLYLYNQLSASGELHAANLHKMASLEAETTAVTEKLATARADLKALVERERQKPAHRRRDDKVQALEKKVTGHQTHLTHLAKQRADVRAKVPALQAIACFERVLAEKKDCLVALELISEAQLLANDKAGAKTNLQQLTQIDPSHYHAWGQLGLLQIKTDPRDAYTSFRACLSSLRDRKREVPFQLWNNLGIVAHRLGKAEEAITAYRRALIAAVKQTPDKDSEGDEQMGGDGDDPVAAHVEELLGKRVDYLEFMKALQALTERHSRSAHCSSNANMSSARRKEVQPTEEHVAGTLPLQVSLPIDRVAQVSCVYNVAHHFEDEGAIPAAVALYLGLLQEYPVYVDCWLSLARMMRKQGHRDEAVYCLDSVLAQNPNNMDALALLFQLFTDEVCAKSKSKDKEREVKELKRAAEEMKQRMDQVHSRTVLKGQLPGQRVSAALPRVDNFRQVVSANAQLAADNPKEAGKRYDMVLSNSPTNIPAATGLAACLLAGGEEQRAKDALVLVREGTSDDPGSWINLAHAYVRQHQYENAIKMYTHVLTKLSHDKDESVLLCLARAHYEMNDFVNCERVILQAIHLNPDSFDLWFNLAIAQEEYALRLLNSCYDESAEAKVRLQDVDLGVAKAMSAKKILIQLQDMLRAKYPDRNAMSSKLRSLMSRAEKHKRFIDRQLENQEGLRLVATAKEEEQKQKRAHAERARREAMAQKQAEQEAARLAELKVREEAERQAQEEKERLAELREQWKKDGIGQRDRRNREEADDRAAAEAGLDVDGEFAPLVDEDGQPVAQEPTPEPAPRPVRSTRKKKRPRDKAVEEEEEEDDDDYSGHVAAGDGGEDANGVDGSEPARKRQRGAEDGEEEEDEDAARERALKDIFAKSAKSRLGKRSAEEDEGEDGDDDGEGDEEMADQDQEATAARQRKRQRVLKDDDDDDDEDDGEDDEDGDEEQAPEVDADGDVAMS